MTKNKAIELAVCKIEISLSFLMEAKRLGEKNCDKSIEEMHEAIEVLKLLAETK